MGPIWWSGEYFFIKYTVNPLKIHNQNRVPYNHTVYGEPLKNTQSVPQLFEATCGSFPNPGLCIRQ